MFKSTTAAAAVLLALALASVVTGQITCDNGNTPVDVNFEVDYDVYVEGNQVKYWGKSGTNWTQDDINQDRLLDVFFRGAIVAVVFGLLFFLGILCWAMCRCCCCRQKCRLHEVSATCQIVLLVLVILMVVIAIIFVGVGLGADKKQSDAMTGIPEVVQLFADIPDEIYNASVPLFDLVEETIDTIENNDGLQAAGVDADDLRQIRDALESIREEASSFDASELTKSFDDDLQDYDKSRSRFLRAVLGVLCAFVVLTAIFALWNAKGPDTCRPAATGACKPITCIISSLTLLLVLILWIVAAVFIYVAQLSSDFCIDADVHVMQLAEFDASADGDIGVYYITCDQDETLRSCNNPFQGDMNSILEALEDFGTTVNDIDCSGAAPYVAECESGKQELINAYNELNNITTTFVDAVLGCGLFNERYQAVVILLCNDFAGSIGSTTQVLLGFAVIFSLTEIFARLLSDTFEEQYGDLEAGSKAV